MLAGSGICVPRPVATTRPRSEEGRVGEKGRSRGGPYHLKKKKKRLRQDKEEKTQRIEVEVADIVECQWEEHCGKRRTPASANLAVVAPQASGAIDETSEHTT